jgi:hypothetical protein
MQSLSVAGFSYTSFMTIWSEMRKTYVARTPQRLSKHYGNRVIFIPHDAETVALPKIGTEQDSLDDFLDYIDSETFHASQVMMNAL